MPTPQEIRDAITLIVKSTNEELLATGLFETRDVQMIQGISDQHELRQFLLLFKPGMTHAQVEEAVRDWCYKGGSWERKRPDVAETV